MSWAPPCSLSSGSSRPLKRKTYYKGIFDARQCLLLSHLIDGQLPLREHPRRPLGSRQRHPLRHRSPSAPSLLEPQVGLTTMLFQRDGKYFQIFNTSRCSFKKIESTFSFSSTDFPPGTLCTAWLPTGTWVFSPWLSGFQICHLKNPFSQPRFYHFAPSPFTVHRSFVLT